MFIVTKTLASGPSGVHRYPAAQQTGAPATLERVASPIGSFGALHRFRP